MICVENAIFCIQCVPINWRDKLIFKNNDILDKADRVKVFFTMTITVHTIQSPQEDKCRRRNKHWTRNVSGKLMYLFVYNYEKIPQTEIELPYPCGQWFLSLSALTENDYNTRHHYQTNENNALVSVRLVLCLWKTYSKL